MEIFKGEKGLTDLILANTSIAYTVEVEPLEKNTSDIVLASVYSDTPNTPDLFYTKSVFVTTNKNKNDDVFLPEETWAARKTPVDKMWNVEHDHSRVVGHITSTWGIDSEGSLIEDDCKDLPLLFHLCAAGVIYKKWQDEDLQAKADELIEGISKGEYFTSMEAHFRSFSYLLEKEGEQKVVARDEDTCFLTKHLRCYGGTGSYDGYTISRALKSIIFSGNAFTKRPANPDSIIFANENKKNSKIIITSGVNLNKEEIFMSENILEKQVAELKEQVKALQVTNRELSDELAAASVEKYEGEVASLKEQVAASQKALADAEAKIESVETAKSALADELKNLNEKLVAATAELNEVKVNAARASRIEKLVEAGLNKEEAEKKVADLVALSDEQFDSVATILASIKPPVAPQSKEPPMVPQSKDAPVVSGSEDEAEDVEATEEEGEVDATVASESDDTQLMAAFAAYYGEQLSKEKK